MNTIIRHIASLCSICLGIQSLAQTPSATASTPSGPAAPVVLSWKINSLGCDRIFVQGQEIESLSTSQALVQVSPGPVIGRFGVYVLIENPKSGTARIDVAPENIHLLRVAEKSLAEIPRIPATKIANSMERRQRIGQSVAAGLSAAGSETTATGTATYSDGTTANYSVTMPNPRAESDAVNRAQSAIASARERGANVVASELKSNTLFPGQRTIGQLFFARQKAGEDLLVRVDIGNASYEFPYHLSKTGEPEPRDVAATSEIRLAPEDVEILSRNQQGSSTSQSAKSADHTQALDAYREGAERGDPEAEFKLGLLYAQGHGVTQDYAQAASWYRRAAEKESAYAQGALGALYYLGEGVPQDYAQAAIWFRKAAEAGVVRAQYMLGSLYAGGRGVQQDYAEAYFWLDLAAARCNVKDQTRFTNARDGAATKLSPTVLTDEQKKANDWSTSHQAQPR